MRTVVNCPVGATTSLGAAGAYGDVIQRLLVVPTSTSPGAIQIQDGASTPVTVFAGGAASIADLKPFNIDLGAESRAGTWKVIVGVTASVVATGKFT